METPVLAIHGRGLVPSLLALRIIRAGIGGAPVLLLSPDAAVCGDQLEPVIASALKPAAQALLEPFVVASWPGYYTVRGGAHERHDDPVWLLDPVQVWLDLQGLLPPAALVAACGPLEQSRGRLSWTGGSALLGRLIDLDPVIGGAAVSQIAGVDGAQALDLAVLADYDAPDLDAADHDTASARWAAYQYLPLGDDRLVIRKLPRADNLVAQHTPIEALLNTLLAD